MNKSVLAMCIAMSLTSCAHIEALRTKNTVPASYVAKEISEVDSETIGEDMAKFLASQFPAAKTTIYVESSDSLVQEVLMEELTEKGFGILPVKPTQGPAVSFQYFVTNLGNGVLVRMRYAETISSRYYGRQSDGSLYASGKIAVREDAK
jgi:hypothetical protein